MQTIEVDFDVFKALTIRRSTEDVSYNDVLRDMLGLDRVIKPIEPAETLAGAWVVKGVTFPAGTEFRAHYKGQIHTGHVENGALVLNNERYDSPSAAAYSITGSGINGWFFWECKFPGTSMWKIINDLRK